MLDLQTEPLVNAHRLRHGDITPIQDTSGKIIAASSKPMSLLSWMIDKGFLEAHHEAYAMTLLDLRMAYDARNGITWTKIETQMKSIDCGDALETYHAICLALGRRSVAFIESTATHVATHALCTAGIGSVLLKHYDRLVEFMDDYRESMKESA